MKDLKIIPLGTISPFCYKNQNCPGFLIKYKNYNILLDCGNGITRYLNFPGDLNNLHVFITHLHKDHYGDLGCIEYSSYVFNNLNKLDNKINIYLPEKYNDPEYSYSNYHQIKENKIYILDDLKITFHNNKSHEIKTYSIKLENDRFKIVYTGDIGKNNLKGIINFSQNADLLICESTFLEKHNSTSTTHLNARDAAFIAKEANVKKLVLTHFWPLENKRLYLKEAKEIFKKTYIAKENRKIKLRRNK